MFSRRESAVFTVKNSICPWAGPKYAKNVDFWRAVTFQRLRLSRLDFQAFAQGPRGFRIRARPVSWVNFGDHDLVTSCYLGQGLRTPCRGPIDPFHRLLSNPTFCLV